MTYDFFADNKDKLKILEFIFKETDLRVFDLYSEFGKEITEYKTLEEIRTKMELETDVECRLYFQLWTSRHKGEPIFIKVELDPKYCNGNTFRYRTAGWGLIQLYFGRRDATDLHSSHIGHFNIKGALKHEQIMGGLGNVSSWDWEEIQKTSRRLRYYIHNKLANSKKGSMGILSGAEMLIKQGVQLR